jgi:hypothetical protein
MMLKNFVLAPVACSRAGPVPRYEEEKWKFRVGESGDHDRILDYWVRRKQGLSEAEWGDFYRLVSGVLVRTRLGRDYADPDARRELIRAFFAEKVILNARSSSAGDLNNAHALHRFLRRFAEDLARKDRRYEALPDRELPDDADDDASGEASDDLALSAVQRLREAGIDVARVVASADDFVRSLDPLEQAYLSENTCEEGEVRQPISAIAARLKASSYHYRAKQLGITRSKGEGFAGYEETKIGKWLCSLGASMAPLWREEILILFNVLCERVRFWREREA